MSFVDLIKSEQDTKITNSLKNRDSFRVIGRSTGTKEFAATRIQTAYRAHRV